MVALTMELQKIPRRELRKELRRPVHLPIRTESGEGFNEWVVDFSISGCRINTPAIFNKGEIITISLFSITKGPAPAKPTYKVGKVVWERIHHNGQGEYGIQFINHPITENGSVSDTGNNFLVSGNPNRTTRLQRFGKTAAKGLVVVVIMTFAFIVVYVATSTILTNQRLLKEIQNLKNRAPEKSKIPGPVSTLSPDREKIMVLEPLLVKATPKKKEAHPVTRFQPSKRVLSQILKAAYSRQGIRTSIAFLDILLATFLNWREDRGLLAGDTLVVSKYEVAPLLDSLRRSYTDNSIDLSSFQQINLFLNKGDFRFEILLSGKGEQAIPHGFGTRIHYASNVYGRIISENLGSGAPHLAAVIDDSSALFFKATAFSFLAGVTEMSIRVAEVRPVQLGAETNLVGVLYGCEDSGNCRAMRSNLEKPALSYVKGTRITRDFLEAKRSNVREFPQSLMN